MISCVVALRRCGLTAARAVLALLVLAFLPTPLFPQIISGSGHQTTRQKNVAHRPKSAVHVVTANGDITLRQADRKDVQIVARLRAHSAARLKAITVTATRERDGTLAVSVKWPGGRPQLLDRCSFEILVPDAQGVRAESGNGSLVLAGFSGRVLGKTQNGKMQATKIQGDVDAQSGNGEIEVTDVAGSLKATTQNGAIRVTKVKGDVKARSGNGQIQATQIGGDVDAQSGNQGIQVKDASRSVKAQVDNGAIEIVLGHDAPGPIAASTGNGSVTIDLGKGFRGQLELSVPWGPIDVDVPGAQVDSSKERVKTVVIDRDGPKSTAHTDNGQIRVRRRASVESAGQRPAVKN